MFIYDFYLTSDAWVEMSQAYYSLGGDVGSIAVTLSLQIGQQNGCLEVRRFDSPLHAR